MKKYLPYTVLAMILAPGFALAALTISDWRYVKAIQLPDISTPQYVKTTLDSDVYSAGNLNDVRIINGQGIEVPYQLLAQEYVRNSSYNSRTLNNSTDASGRTSFVVDLGTSGAIHNQVAIDNSSLNYRRQVSIYASDTFLSDSSSGWKLLLNNGYIYKFSDSRVNLIVEGNTVSYPQNSSRFIKVVISSGSEGAVAVRDAAVSKQESQELLSKVISARATIENDGKNSSTVLTFDLGSSGIFTNNITLAASDSNFSRRVVVESSVDGSSWNYLTQGYISHLETPLFTGGSLSLSYSEMKARYIRATVFNENDQPLSLQNTAHFVSPVRSIVFRADPSASYSLYYGNPTIAPPHYDLSRIFQYLETDSFTLATLGLRSLNEKYIPPPPPTIPYTESHKYLLNSALVLLVVLIGVMVYFYLRKTVVKKAVPLDGHDKPSNFVKL